MKILILTDLEGTNGVYSFQQSRDAHGSPINVEALRLQVGEINAAVRGAFAGGATRVVVPGLGGHGGPVDLTDVDERAELVHGAGPNFRREAEEADFDAIFMTGFHAMSNTPGGILSHTGSSKNVQRMWMNDHEVGEVEHIAVRYGALGLPIVFLSGDDKVVAEVQQFLGDQPVYVEVKKGLAREAGWMLSPARAQQLIEQGAEEAMGRVAGARPYTPGFPLRVRAEIKQGPVEKFLGDASLVNSTTTEHVVETADGLWR